MSAWTGFLRTALLIFLQTLRLQLRQRSLFLFGLLCAVLGVILVFVGHRAAASNNGVEFYGFVAYLIVVQVMLPFLLLYLAVKAVHGDLEDRTATYLFMRPLHRPAILIGKWLAVVVVGSLLAAVALTVVFLALNATSQPWRHGLAPTSSQLWTFVQGAALGAPAYGALGVLFATWFKRPLVFGAVFVLGFELIASNLPPQAGVRSMTVADPVRRWLVEGLQPTGELRQMLVGALHGVDHLRLGDPIDALLRLTLLSMAFALIIYSWREYDARAGE